MAISFFVLLDPASGNNIRKAGVEARFGVFLETHFISTLEILSVRTQKDGGGMMRHCRMREANDRGQERGREREKE